MASLGVARQIVDCADFFSIFLCAVEACFDFTAVNLL